MQLFRGLLMLSAGQEEDGRLTLVDLRDALESMRTAAGSSLAGLHAAFLSGSANCIFTPQLLFSSPPVPFMSSVTRSNLPTLHRLS